MKRRSFLTTVGIAGVSGCLRLTEGSGSSPTQTGDRRTIDETELASTPMDTPTPADTETPGEDTEKPGELPLPDGLSEDGVNGFLYPSHARSLQEKSFQAQWMKFNLKTSRTEFQRTYRGDHGVALGNWNRPFSGNKVEIYRSGQNNYWREQLGGRTTYGNDKVGQDPAIWGREVKPFLKAADWSAPTRTNEGRPARWEVTSSTVDTESAVPGYYLGGTVASISSARMVIDERGIIRTIEAIYTIKQGNDETKYRIDYTIDSIGDVSVSEPSWLATAKEQVPTVTAALTDDNQFIRFSIESGNRLEPGSVIQAAVEDRPRVLVVKIEKPVETGEPTYLYKPADNSGTWKIDAGIVRGSPSTDVSTASLDGSYALTARRRTTHYFTGVDVS